MPSCRPATASRVVHVESSLGETAAWIERARRARPAARAARDLRSAPRLVGARSRGRTTAGSAIARLAPRLVEHVRRSGFTHVELLPVIEHPFDGSWGYQVTGYFAPTARYGDARRLRAFVDHLSPERHRRDPRLGARALSARRFRAASLRRHGALRARRSAARRASRLGHADLQLRASRGAQLPASPTRSTGSRNSTSTACASMRSRRCSTSTTRAEPGEWTPESLRGPREPRGDRVPARPQSTPSPNSTPAASPSPRSRPPGPASRSPVDEGGLGFTFKWNMGWMHDTLALLRARSRAPSLAPGRAHLRDALRASASASSMPLSHDEVVHGKGSLLAKMPGDEWQRFANLRVAARLPVDAAGQEARLHGNRARALAASGAHDASLDWHLAERSAARRAARASWPTWVALYRAQPCLWRWDPDPVGFEWIDCIGSRPLGALLPALGRRCAPRDRAQSRRRRAPRLPNRRALPGAAIESVSVPTLRSTAGATRRPSAASSQTTARGTDSRTRSSSRCRRCRLCCWCPRIWSTCGEGCEARRAGRSAWNRVVLLGSARSRAPDFDRDGARAVRRHGTRRADRESGRRITAALRRGARRALHRSGVRVSRTRTSDAATKAAASGRAMARSSAHHG